MKKLLTTLFLASYFTLGAAADTLPSLNVKDWLSYHAVSKGKYHGIGVTLKGGIHLYFMNRDERLNLRTPVELEIVLERKEKKAGSKWVKKKIKLDGFINPPKSAKNPEKLSLHGVVTDDVEFKLDFEFTKAGVRMMAVFGTPAKDAESADYRLSLVSDLEELYSMSATADDEAKDIKGKTRGSDLRIQTRKGKPVKVRFYEPIEIEKLEKDEIVSLELKSEKIGRKKLYWSLADAKKGSLQIEPRAESKMPYKGFRVATVLIDETGKRVSDGLILEYR